MNKRIFFILLIISIILFLDNLYIGYSTKKYNYVNISSSLLMILVFSLMLKSKETK